MRVCVGFRGWELRHLEHSVWKEKEKNKTRSDLRVQFCKWRNTECLILLQYIVHAAYSLARHKVREDGAD